MFIEADPDRVREIMHGTNGRISTNDAERTAMGEAIEAAIGQAATLDDVKEILRAILERT